MTERDRERDLEQFVTDCTIRDRSVQTAIPIDDICDKVLLLLMVSSSLYVSHMFVTRVLSSLVFRVVLL